MLNLMNKMNLRVGDKFVALSDLSAEPMNLKY